MKDWAEVKMGVRAILLFLLGLLAVWLVGASQYALNNTPIAGRQALVYGFPLVVMLTRLSYAYWRPEQARKKVRIINRVPDEAQVPLSQVSAALDEIGSDSCLSFIYGMLRFFALTMI